MKARTQVSNRHYEYESGYDTSERFQSYFVQVSETLKLQPESLLEIGIGNKTVSDYLSKRIPKVITMDFDKALTPDIVADVTGIPLKNDLFDVVLCCEVLEHIPFKCFQPALKEISRVSKKYLLLSLPHYPHPISLTLKIPGINKKRISIEVPYPKKHHFDGQHYWEIGKKGYPLQKIKALILQDNNILKEFRDRDNPYHHFFILESHRSF